MLRLRQLTAPGASALAVLEVSGGDASAFLHSLGVSTLPSEGQLRLARLRLGRGLREQALLVATRRGYEIQTHGNPLLIRAILDGAPPQATAPAAASVETWGQSILRVARAIRGQYALRLALFQLGREGSTGLLQDLTEGGSMDRFLCDCETALSRADAVRACLRPHRIVLRGRVNSGKSTLFNVLVGRERVRTGPKPALTRDPVWEEILYRDRVLWIVDTAGESEGLQDLDLSAEGLGRREGDNSDLVLWLHSNLETNESLPREQEALLLETHHPRPDIGRLHLDLLRLDPSALRAAVLDRVLDRLGLVELPPLAPAPLDEGMERGLRWLLDQPDRQKAARRLLAEGPPPS